MANTINRNSSTLLMIEEEEDNKLAFIEQDDSDFKNASDFIQGSNSTRNHYKQDYKNEEDQAYLRKSDSYLRFSKTRASRDYNAANIFGDEPLINHSNYNFSGKFAGQLSE